MSQPNTLEDLFNRLCQYEKGLHVLFGTVGSGKTHALFAITEILAPQRKKEGKNIFFIEGDDFNFLEKSLGSTFAEVNKPRRKSIDNPTAILRRLDYITDNVFTPLLENVPSSQHLDVVGFGKFFETSLWKLWEVIEILANKKEISDIVCDVSVNSLAMPTENGDNDSIAFRARAYGAFFSKVRKIITQNEKNIYFQFQAANRNSNGVDNLISIPSFVTHTADTLWNVELMRGQLDNYIHLSNKKDRCHQVGGEFFIPIVRQK